MKNICYILPVPKTRLPDDEQTTIALAPELINAVRTGRETATIRKGHRTYATGLAFFDAQQTQIPIEITALEYRTFKDLTDEDARLNGSTSNNELKASLKRYYPDLKDTDEVTIVHFKLVK